MHAVFFRVKPLSAFSLDDPQKSVAPAGNIRKALILCGMEQFLSSSHLYHCSVGVNLRKMHRPQSLRLLTYPFLIQFDQRR